MKRHFPILSWLPDYPKAWLKDDIVAGLTVGVMLIPQGMAYAMLAGMPPIYGLYAATIPLVIYAIFGTSRQLAVGPAALDALIVYAGVSAFAQAGSEHFISLAIALAFIQGLILVAFGIFRLGFLVNFLSRPVISGFTSAAALIIALSQLKHLLGVSLPNSKQPFVILSSAITSFSEWSWATILLGLGGIVLIKLVKKFQPKVPGALLAVGLSLLVVYLFRLDGLGVKIVGKVPEGLPEFALPHLSLEVLSDLLPLAFTLALIAFMEAISVAKAIQAKHRNYTIDPNQELIALGMSNVLGSLFQSFSVTGGLSRTAVNNQAGAKTGLAAIISATLIALTLLFLTPVFYYLPRAILASIIMVAVLGLMDFSFPKLLLRTDKRDLLMLLVTFLSTLFLGIANGIAVGILLSIVMVIFRSAKPHMAQLGRIKNSSYYRNIDRFKEAEIFDDVLIVRCDAQLFFANAIYFRDQVLSWAEPRSVLKRVIIDAQPINNIDSSAMHVLNELTQHFAEHNIQVSFAGVKGPVRDQFHKAKFDQTNSNVEFYMNVHEAVENHFELMEKPPQAYVRQAND